MILPLMLTLVRENAAATTASVASVTGTLVAAQAAAPESMPAWLTMVFTSIGPVLVFMIQQSLKARAAKKHALEFSARRKAKALREDGIASNDSVAAQLEDEADLLAAEAAEAEAGAKKD